MTRVYCSTRSQYHRFCPNLRYAVLTFLNNWFCIFISLKNDKVQRKGSLYSFPKKYFFIMDKGSNICLFLRRKRVFNDKCVIHSSYTKDVHYSNTPIFCDCNCSFCLFVCFCMSLLCSSSSSKSLIRLNSRMEVVYKSK